MRGFAHQVLLLSFFLLFISPCVPERAERKKSLDLREKDDGVDVNQKHTPSENQPTLIKHEIEDGLESNDEGKQKDGPSIRFEPTNIDFIPLFFE